MSSFLQQLKSGGFEIDNQKGADSRGVMVRRIEKRFAAEPADKLGLRLSDDAEILEITKGSLAAKAQVPPHFIIFDVNDHFIESRNDFIEFVNGSPCLNLVIKMQSVSPMRELIGMTIRDDENREAIESGKNPGATRIDFEALLRTTPRFGFLSVSHPLFRRYNDRLQERREAVALVRRRTQETEEQLRRERSEMMRREMEAAAEEERKKKQEEEARLAAEKARAAAAAAAAAQSAKASESESFIKVVNDESSFAATVKPPVAEENQASPIDSKPTSAAPSPPPAEQEKTAAAAEAVSAMELLALIGVPAAGTPPPLAVPAGTNNSILGAGNPAKSQIVTCVTLPAEEYTLSTGERVVSILKKRTGPIPAPPPGNPPRAKKTSAKSPLSKVTDNNRTAVKRQREETA